VPAGTRPEAMVKALARKFFGSGPPVVWDFRTLAIGNLLGTPIAMDGRTYPLSAGYVPDPGGQGFGMFIDVSPANEALLRWARGAFSDNEHEFAASWRRGLNALSLGAFEDVIQAGRIVYRRCRSIDEVGALATELLRTDDLQPRWIEYLIAELQASPPEAMAIRRRWRAPAVALTRNAPFAAHCLRVTVAYAIAKHFALVPTEPKDPMDLQYLCYLPFCSAFVTSDKLQSRIAPVLMRARQTLCDGNAFKLDLRRRNEYWQGISEVQQTRLSHAFGMYPWPLRDSLVSQLWKEHVGPWQRGYGSSQSDLTLEEGNAAMLEADRMWSEAWPEDS